MDYKKIADTALLAGRIMLESNAETYRVEETVRHILSVAKVEHTESFVLPTGIMITLDDENMEAISLIKRITTRSTDLRKIHKVNSISRDLKSGVITIHEAYRLLVSVDEQEYKQIHFDIAVITLAIAFTVLLGGNMYDSFLTCINAIILVLVWTTGRHLKIGSFFSNVIASILMGLIATLCTRHFPNLFSLDSVMVGSIMPMVPGTIITNAIRDTFHGDFLSGASRAIEAVFIAVSIALGVAIGLSLGGGGGLLQ
ncbi:MULTISPECIES: threonine/serine exporter ThrE family protein [unclassified Granulicatella]|uniref:threonine/serine ThrE exporter family protein n=1 Tax=unclassified Granulicatella TaxID=2630493 RepID=UPI00107339BC|nr:MULTISPECIES: threonine/serine exporter family protein [unclassified Granulicatella]MBF0780268.1 threonine/serine exporter family protein [Granulicatella sp. 19428wC4_WM01]TFU95604.1 threonine/serine exporter [Granulicatella sp. WM01]